MVVPTIGHTHDGMLLPARDASQTRPHTAIPTDMQEAPADQSTPKGQKCLVNIGTFLVTDTQAAELIQPSEGSFHHPAPAAQSGAAPSIALGEQRPYVPDAQSLPNRSRMVGAVAQQVMRARTRSSSLALERWDCID